MAPSYQKQYTDLLKMHRKAMRMIEGLKKKGKELYEAKEEIKRLRQIIDAL